MKKCARCQQELPEDNFKWKNEARGWRQPYCIECNKAYQKEHYQKNKRVYLDKAKVWSTVQYGKVLDFLRENPCVDCGESDIVCLEFDHRDRADKTIAVSAAIQNGWSWDRIKTEIDKCDVRCRNCHAKVTAKQLGWTKAMAL